MKIKLFRVTTVPISLKVLLEGQHRFMSKNGFKVIGISSPGKELEEVHHNEGIAVTELEMTRTISPIKDIKALWNFYKLCKREKPLIVHSHTPKAGIVSMLAAKFAGVPIRLHTVAGLPLMEATGCKRKILDFVEKLTYASATKIYPNSRGLYNFILDHNYTRIQKLKIIAKGSSNGINTFFYDKANISMEEQTAIRKKLYITEDDFVFVFVGRLVGDKGINELVTAFTGLQSGTCTPKLLLVGSFEPDLDPLKKETLEVIESNQDIISVGFQKDVRLYFSISDVLVFPSYREGFPNVVMQAGAMGLPSIVSNINGCNEIIVEGENGTIIPVKNHEVLYHAMNKMMDNQSYYELLKSNSRSMIQSRYEQSLVWNELLNEYNQLITEYKS